MLNFANMKCTQTFVGSHVLYLFVNVDRWSAATSKISLAENCKFASVSMRSAVRCVEARAEHGEWRKENNFSGVDDDVKSILML